MSLRFFKRKSDASDFWGGRGKAPLLVKVWVPAVRGFLQAGADGFYWVTKEMAKKLKFKTTKPKEVLYRGWRIYRVDDLISRPRYEGRNVNHPHMVTYCYGTVATVKRNIDKVELIGK